MKLVLFDSPLRECLLPLTYIRPVAELRSGIFTMRERWEKIFNAESTVLTAGYLQSKFPCEPADDCLYINAHLVSTDANLIRLMKTLQPGDAILDGEILVAGRNGIKESADYLSLTTGKFEKYVPYKGELKWIKYPWQLFMENDRLIRHDFERIRKETEPGELSQTNQLIQKEDIIIEKGAKAEYCIINASEGPVYIGRDCLLMEGCSIRGPVALCEGSVLKMGARVYGATTLGPYSMAGGEIKNSVFLGYSNKAHDGYLGDSVIGEWCNIGAGTSNSNIKNNASDVRAWNYREQDFVSVGLKCGLIMGDYSRCSINTSFNTGTVTGICTHIFGRDFPPKFLPDFTWDSPEKPRYELAKAFTDISNWMKLKGKSFTETDKKILQSIFENKI